jgi:hypothetical protein
MRGDHELFSSVGYIEGFTGHTRVSFGCAHCRVQKIWEGPHKKMRSLITTVSTVCGCCLVRRQLP